RGGYVLLAERGDLDAIIIATGSEVELGVAAAERLSAQGKGVRVVSMPSTDVFMAQDADYRDRVLPPQVRARVAVEAAHPDYWYRFVGLDGAVVGIDRFGVSAPGGEAMAVLGITADNVVAAVQGVLDGK
ncbi:MAG: transketolase, partial [Gammaproteobacteria bacterium]|nr:transketolase [Gammaproteobacteria bacterium]